MIRLRPTTLWGLLVLWAIRPATGMPLVYPATEPSAEQESSGATSASASENTAEDTSSKAHPSFGGPDAVENQLEEDAAEKRPLVPRKVPRAYFDWKERLQEKRGLSLGMDYSAAYLVASESSGEDQAASGMFRFYGSWDLVGRDRSHNGALVWKVEHRHAYTDLAPSDLQFNFGAIGLIVPPFSDQGARVTNLYWRHRLDDGRFALIGGFLDATDYFDVYALASPWTGFLNFAFSTGTTTVPLPNDATLGVAAAGMLTERIFLIAGVADTNSDPTDPFEGFDTLFDQGETFKSLELGWTPSQDRIYLDNVHLTLWQVDEREEAGTPDGWGVNVSLSRYLAGRWLPFVRAGWAEDGGSLMESSVSVGFGYQRVPGRDLLGFGVNWGRPNPRTFDEGLDDQSTVELFYRLQVGEQFALTPDVQLVLDPAKNPESSSIWVFGLRARFTL